MLLLNLMNQAKAKSFLETASNIAVIVVALVIVGSLARSYFRSAPRVLLERGLHKGAQLPSLPGIDFSKSQRTLLVALDPNCNSCSESLPLLQSLVNKLHLSNSNARMITLFQGVDEQTKRYAEASRLNVESIFGVDFNLLELSALPSVILVDAAGTILDFWIGKPSGDTAEQMFKYLAIDLEKRIRNLGEAAVIRLPISNPDSARTDDAPAIRHFL